jgi:hypothetical protein
MDLVISSDQVFVEAGFATRQVLIRDRQALLFEDGTVLGFLFAYENPAELIGRWENDAEAAVSSHQLGLRRGGQKAWNTYVVLLAGAAADFGESIRIGAIEEDLTGTRKIAFAGIKDLSDIRAALLPLMPIQSAPKLEAADIANEIRQRTTQLPRRAVDAFLSDADDAVVIQVLEESP